MATRLGLHALACKDPLGDMRPVLHDGVWTGVQWGDQILALARPKTRAERAEVARIEAALAARHWRMARIVRTWLRGRWTFRIQMVLDQAHALVSPANSF